MRKLGVVALLIALVGLVCVPAASALSRKQANRIAIKALKPAKQRGVAVLFGLRKPLKKGVVVREGGASKARPFKLKRRGWVFWLDRQYGALFAHPSTVLVVDDRSRKVRYRKNLGWYPLVNGRRPAFLSTRRGYRGKKYRIAANVKLSGRPRAASRRRRAAPRARGAQVTKQDLANDCLITVGDQKEPGLAGSFESMEQWADRVGMARSQRRAETLTDLKAAVAGFTTATACNDVFIFLAGHGTPAKGVPIVNRPPGRPVLPTVHGPARVATRTKTRGTKEKTDYITPGDLKTLMDSLPNITFKLKIESCFSGRFKDELEGKVPNLRVLETSSAHNEVSTGETPRYPDRNGRIQTNPTPNPNHAGEFANANAIGLTQWATSATEVATHGRDLAYGIARSAEIAKTKDFGHVQGRTHIQVSTNFTPEFFATWTHGTTTTNICVYVRGAPGQQGDVTVTGSAQPLDGSVKAFRLDGNGRRLVTFRINVATRYAISVRGAQAQGTFNVRNGEVTVADPPTNGSPPPAGSNPPACPAPS